MSDTELDIPDWVPAAVIQIAALIPGKPEIKLAMLTDARMKQVWQELQKHPVTEATLSQLSSWQRLSSFDISVEGITLQDQACAAFFAGASFELSNHREIWTRGRANEFAERWTETRNFCAWIMNDQMFDPVLQASAASLVANLDLNANMLDDGGWLSGQHNPAYFFERSRGENRSHGDDEDRGRSRAIAVIAKKIFGSFLCGTVATVINVACRSDVNTEQVRRWCEQSPALLPEAALKKTEATPPPLRTPR
jgi:hypothetical protein